MHKKIEFKGVNLIKTKLRAKIFNKKIPDFGVKLVTCNFELQALVSNCCEITHYK